VRTTAIFSDDQLPCGSSKKFDASVNSLDAYLAILDSARRKRLKKKLSTSHQQGDLTEETIQNPDERLLAQLFKLFNQTYQKGKTKFEHLDVSFFRQVATASPAWWVILRDPKTADPVAFNLCFRVGNVVIQKFIGLNYHLDKEWFLYFRLWESSVNWALSVGATEIQCGQTGYSAKLEVGYTIFPLTNFCRHTNPLVNKVCASFAKKITWSTLDNDLAVYLEAHPEMLAQSKATA
jgi:predicted N-acyltransferase